ncbi:MmgE/PrpD family protein [Kitasatospora phosalacinea]|uniref:MmgE/PrpD family protein n=1 Tax=Kitasatospora phosalacinea TaxID=2065 RepID=A0ABW6GRN8_9ACTN
MVQSAERLARWAAEFTPSSEDLLRAERALRDTVAVALAARAHPMAALAAPLPDAARWAAMAHVLDFDDLHLPSTTHISTVCVPAVLAAGGDARAYLAGAGVMARLGTALGWAHYTSGWHATCTAGAPAAAVAAGLSLGLDADGLARAIALALPAAGGVQRAFGTDAKALQVGFAAEAGVRAARLAAAGAGADAAALDEWLPLVGGAADRLDLTGPAVPDGLATKLFPCCYAMQRPIGAARALAAALDLQQVERIAVHTPRAAVHPLIHREPATGLQAKFSLEYAVVTALLDGFPGFDAFTDDAVRRPAVRRLLERVAVFAADSGGNDLLTGATEVEVTLAGGRTVSRRLALPPGAPGLPATDEEFAAKVAGCGPDVPALLEDLTWASAATLLADAFPAR